jgi:hypothetical protein
MILKILSPKNAVLTQNTAKFCKTFIIRLGFKKNANFSAENWQKPLKLVIITLTPGGYCLDNASSTLSKLKYFTTPWPD